MEGLSPENFKVNETKDLNVINLTYKVKDRNQNLRIFGDRFYENNRNNFKLFINEEEIQFCDILSPEQLKGKPNI